MLVWIASYPRSGNTWTRLLLNAMLEPGWSAAAGDVRFAPIVSGRTFIERHSGLWTSDLRPAEITEVRRAAHEAASRLSARPFFVKAHDNYFLSPSSADTLFAPSGGSRILYVVRDPTDVAPSLAAFLGIDIGAAVDLMCDPEAELASHRGTHDQVDYRLGDWSGHVTGWLSHRGDDVFCIRYERLREDAARVLAEMRDWLDLDVDDGRVTRAAEQVRFDRMQAKERESGFSEASPAGPFFRRGRSGGGRRDIPADTLDRLVTAHGDVMRSLGYSA